MARKTIMMPKVKMQLFGLLDEDGDQHLSSKEMKKFAGLRGFEGSNDEWVAEYRELSGRYGWDRRGGPDVHQFVAFLSDKGGPGYCDDEELMTYCQNLEFSDNQKDEERHDGEFQARMNLMTGNARSPVGGLAPTTPARDANRPPQATPTKAPHPDEMGRQKMECPRCGYKSFPQWMNDKAHCLKCDHVLKVRHAGGGGAGLALPTVAEVRPKSPASKLNTPVAPQPRQASKSPQPGLRDTNDRVKMECPKCGYKSFPQWMNDEARCLKCQTVLKRRAVGGGAAAGSEGRDLARPLPSGAIRSGRSASPNPAVDGSMRSRDGRSASPNPAPSGGGVSVAAAFQTFAGAGKADMDGKSFAKLCRDCKLIGAGFTSTEADLLFARVATKGQRRITLPQFERALEHIAQKKNKTFTQIRAAVAGTGGPVLSGTQADAVRFHDDKSTYTGAHINGGPEQVVKGLGTVG
eukprot:CAMPEP_0172800762 /NCGR_PEP_ID=MMETSP1075-20121228/2782_1 /TAXON_ID=2916 /ORGANISM="Ceratium fusus, Strain PA161109" /LENGTH=463 /DNA_ID=CAMNT_0013638719 /DNA_START=58 /DNA_END=1449 /DNA_ORIENTATION=+